jgi:hypothetical protein
MPRRPGAWKALAAGTISGVPVLIPAVLASYHSYSILALILATAPDAVKTSTGISTALAPLTGTGTGVIGTGEHKQPVPVITLVLAASYSAIGNHT